MAKKNTSAKPSTKIEKQEPKKNNSPIIGIVVGAFIFIALIVIGVIYFNSQDTPIVVEPVVNITSDVEEPVVEVTPEPTIPEKFDLTPLEKDVLDKLSYQRQVFNLDAYTLDLKLSEQLTNHTIEMARTRDVSSLDQFSSTTTRAKAAGVNFKIIESNLKVTVANDGNPIQAIFDKLPKQNLYINDYTHIALSISQADTNEYYVTLDLYKVEE